MKVFCTFKTSYRLIKCRHYAISHLLSALGQALGRLVSVSSMHRCTSTPDLSTSYSLRVLTTFVGTSHLGGGFTLRCLQRLSLPDLATQLCHWYDNWCTSGLSSPVLSYYGQLPSDILRPRRIGTELSHDVLNPARVPL